MGLSFGQGSRFGSRFREGGALPYRESTVNSNDESTMATTRRDAPLGRLKNETFHWNVSTATPAHAYSRFAIGNRGGEKVSGSGLGPRPFGAVSGE